MRLMLGEENAVVEWCKWEVCVEGGGELWGGEVG
jgi:hypothetical protein